VVIAESPVTMPARGELPAQLLIGIRPEDVKITRDGEFAGQVVLKEPLGVETVLHIKAGNQTLLALVPGMAEARLGEMVKFNIATNKLHFFDTARQRVNA
jgi:ABC-type sugar transport system ATPase subunit